MMNAQQWELLYNKFSTYSDSQLKEVADNKFEIYSSDEQEVAKEALKDRS